MGFDRELAQIIREYSESDHTASDERRLVDSLVRHGKPRSVAEETLASMNSVYRYKEITKEVD